MTQAEALAIVQRYVEKKVENEGIDEWGLLSAQDFNALARLVISITTIGGLTNVTNADASPVNDVVLYKPALSREWTIKPLSEIMPTMDSQPTHGSDNPVTSNGIYLVVQDILSSIDELGEAIDGMKDEIERVFDGGSAREYSQSLMFHSVLDGGRAADYV